MVDIAPRTRKQHADETSAVDAEVDAQLAETSGEASVDVTSLASPAARHLGGRAPRRARDRRADPRCSASTGLSLEEHRERVLEPAAACSSRTGRCTARSRSASAATTTTAATSPASRSSSRPTRPCRSSRACSGACSAPPSCTSAPRSTTTKFLPGIMSLEVPGAFAMTETGHGSDVAAIGTTATYDPETEEFVIHTPVPRRRGRTTSATRRMHGIAAVVFAQLITKGVNHGVHCFYVPIRDENGEFLPGIGGEDDGLKGGLNGIDNGRLHFDHVRVPRTNLLNRYGDVAEDGTYSSARSPAPAAASSPCSARSCRAASRSTAPPSRHPRIGARPSRSPTATSAASSRRAATPTRRCSSTTGAHQRRLLPRLATTYATIFAHDEFLAKFDGVFSGAADTDDDREDLETLAAALKPLSHLARARHPAGGPRGLRRRRASSPRTASSGCAPTSTSTSTFEGDNNVLLQLVGQAAAHRLRQASSKSADAGALARYVVEPGGGHARTTAPGCASSARPSRDFGSTARSVERSCATPTRSASCSPTASRRWSPSIAGAPAPGVASCSKTDAAALFNAHQNELIEAARAHAELLQWEAFTRCASSSVDGRRHQAGADLAARPVRPRPDREAPRLVPHQRPALGAARRRRSPPTSTGCSRACARTRWTSSTRSATSRSTCAHRSPRAPRPSARTRRARTTPPSAHPAPPRRREVAQGKKKR